MTAILPNRSAVAAGAASNGVLDVLRRPERFVSDDSRVILRFLNLGDSRARSILQRVLELGDDQVECELERTMQHFASRHRDVVAAFHDNFRAVKRHLRGRKLDESRQRLIGAYFTLEYSIEAAALFNPSIVRAPSQEGVPDGAVRFIISMRATGEGHISSIVFRKGLVHGDGRIEFGDPPRFSRSARPIHDRQYEKSLFARKLTEMGTHEDQFRQVLDRLGDWFTLDQLRESLRACRREAGNNGRFQSASRDMVWLANANYELHFPPDADTDEMVIFPATAHESKGMEDLRLVRFVDDDGSVCYLGTYTAYDGRRTFPMLLETPDFHNFKVSTLNGRYARNKGFAIFPRKVDGQYVMCSRHDGESLYILRSDNLHFWNDMTKLQTPMEPWEMVQIGNCGSPLETDAGWILLTHGVGPVRHYCIGAMLLDKHDPTKVLGRLRQPLMAPTTEEREGYVPNVLYSCGAMIHNDRLLIPYAMSDLASAFAEVSVHALVEKLLADGP